MPRLRHILILLHRNVSTAGNEPQYSGPMGAPVGSQRSARVQSRSYYRCTVTRRHNLTVGLDGNGEA